MNTFLSFRERFGRRRILWQTRLGAYCVGVDEFVPVALVATLDDGRDLNAIERETGIRFFSRERAEGRREAYDDAPGTYVLLPGVEREVAAAVAQAPAEDWLAICPYPSPPLAGYAAKAGIQCRTLDWETFQWFARKFNLQAGQEELGLPRLAGRWIRLGGARYLELVSEFGSKFVAQLDLSAAGRGTVVVESEAQCASAAERFGNTEVWVTPYAGALSLNVNAIATPEGTAVGYPSVQIVAQAALNNARSGHCGNDFTATAELPRSALESIREQTARIGGWMATRGFRGIFGLDFVMDEKTGVPHAVDLNPRWQGSTSLQAQAERRGGRVPLAAVEIAYQAGLVSSREVLDEAGKFFEPLEGSQIFPKSFADGFWRAQGTLEAGVYSPAMTFLRPALRLHQLVSTEEVLVTGGIPRPGRSLAPGATLARMCSLRAAVEPNSGKLHPWAEEAARGLYGTLELEAVRE